MIRTSFNDGWQARPKANRFLEMAGMAPPTRTCACRTTP